MSLLDIVDCSIPVENETIAQRIWKMTVTNFGLIGQDYIRCNGLIMIKKGNDTIKKYNGMSLFIRI